MTLKEVNFSKNILGENGSWTWLEGINIQSSLNLLDLSYNEVSFLLLLFLQKKKFN